MNKYHYQPLYISAAQREFLRHDFDRRPKHVLDTSVTLARYDEMSAAFAEAHGLPTRINYAIKAQSAAPLLEDLIVHGMAHESRDGHAQFGLDAASKGEIIKALTAAERAGVTPLHIGRRITLSNPNMQPQDMDFALSAGVRSFVLHNCRQLYALSFQAQAQHCAHEVTVLARIPGPDTALHTGGIKFGSDAATCVQLLQEAKRLGMQPLGLAAHIGWQIPTAVQTAAGLEAAFIFARSIWDKLAQQDIHLTTLDLGGGWPNQFRGAPVPAIAVNARTVRNLVDTYFPDQRLQLILEPGNYLAAAAGITKCTVTNVDTVPGEPTHLRCVLDVGIFNGGLVDKHYPVSILLGDELLRAVVDTRPDPDSFTMTAFGPSCDSVDVVIADVVLSNDQRVRRQFQAMLDDNTAPNPRPASITLILHGTGAYTSEMTVGPCDDLGFNSIYNPRVVVLRKNHAVPSAQQVSKTAS